jgi:hypothetical protein
VYATAKKHVDLPTAVEYLSAAIAGGSAWRQMSEALRAGGTRRHHDRHPWHPAHPDPRAGVQQLRRPSPRRRRSRRQGNAWWRQGLHPSGSDHAHLDGCKSSENAALQSGTFVVFNNQVTKAAYGGYVTISEQDLDWTDPNVLSLILDDMGRIYANTTDNVAADNLAPGIDDQSNFTAASAGDPAYWASWIAASAPPMRRPRATSRPTCSWHLASGRTCSASRTPLTARCSRRSAR